MISRRMFHLRRHVQPTFFFSSGAKPTASSASRAASNATYYYPTKELSFPANGRLTVFEDVHTGSVTNVPYELKEISAKRGITLFCLVVIDHMMPIPYFLPALAIGGEWVYRIHHLMSNAVTRVDLHSDGRGVTLTLRKGGTVETSVEKIYKAREEKSLVETFEEPYLFPVEVEGAEGKKSKYYLYGHGHEAIKDGELFRAIINGTPVHV